MLFDVLSHGVGDIMAQARTVTKVATLGASESFMKRISVVATDLMSAGDKDHDGKLDTQELAAVMGIDETEAFETISQFDMDGDGKLDKNELMALQEQRSIDRNRPEGSEEKPVSRNNTMVAQ